MLFHMIKCNRLDFSNYFIMKKLASSNYGGIKMSLIECRQFEQKIAFHMAPSLFGIKCANLISLSRKDFDIPEHIKRFNQKVSARGLTMKILCTCNDKVLILLYHKKKLSLQLKKKQYLEILKLYGYSESMSLDEMFYHLSERINCYSEFPHEIGVFLGYPADDVIGFIENKGENYSLCGYWKVYGDKEFAQNMFKRYDRCRQFLCDKLNQGYDIYQALKIS